MFSTEEEYLHRHAKIGHKSMYMKKITDSTWTPVFIRVCNYCYIFFLSLIYIMTFKMIFHVFSISMSYFLPKK